MSDEKYATITPHDDFWIVHIYTADGHMFTCMPRLTRWGARRWARRYLKRWRDQGLEVVRL